MRVNLVLEELALNVRDYGVVDGRRFDILIDSSPSSVWFLRNWPSMSVTMASWMAVVSTS